MSSIVLSPGATGAAAFTIEAPSTATSRVITLPDATDTLVGKATTDTLTNKSIAATQLTGSVAVANGGTGLTALGPAFSAYLGSNQTPSNATYTKVQINTESFDTASCFDTSTYRFTPNVAGYYQIQAACRISGTSPSGDVWAIYKNGSNVNELNVTTTITFEAREVSTLLSMNGTTDYVEFYCYINAASGQTFNSGSSATWFQGYLVRAA